MVVARETVITLGLGQDVRRHVMVSLPSIYLFLVYVLRPESNRSKL